MDFLFKFPNCVLSQVIFSKKKRILAHSSLHLLVLCLKDEYITLPHKEMLSLTKLLFHEIKLEQHRNISEEIEIFKMTQMLDSHCIRIYYSSDR
jgi:hypothetical protein